MLDYYIILSVLKKTRMNIICVISCAGTPRNIPVLQQCIASIKKAETKTVSATIVVTTNNARHVIKGVSGIDRIFVSKKDAGFVGINNKAVYALRSRRSDFFLIINDDAWIEPEFFKNLERCQKQAPDGGVFVPYILEANTKQLDSFGVEYFKTGYSKNAFSSKIPTSLASMSCLVIKTSTMKGMIHTYGYFLNPLLKWYLDDVDFSIRALGRNIRFVKCKSMIAHHQRTYTWGRKSYLVMYQSFRNLLWIIVLTWPSAVIRRNFFRIVCWQCVTCCYCLVKYSPFMYPKIIWDTLRHRKLLQKERQQILRQQINPVVFSTIFSSLEVRHPRITF